ncbi:hypothetical protein F4781DRAFT_426706 [Annulohypoxylon bovei var. microspora]|nr:hypothetical protein F4781DRAFT_426706 [Annulohypoxylon bovei var. microspora]
MYGIIAFNKGEKSPAAEFPAEHGRYGRGSACKECRISRVRCSGKLDGKNCDRCKRLAKPCLYISNQTQRHHRSTQSLERNPRGSASTGVASETSDNHSSDASGSSPPGLSSGDESQFATEDPLGLDFERWLQLQSNPTVTEPIRPPIDLVATPPQTSPDSLCISLLEPEGSLENGVMCETSTSHFSGLGDGIAGPKPAECESFPDLQSWIADTRGSTSRCKCLPAMTSSLSILRSWTWGGGPGIDSGMRTDDATFNYVKVEDFLTVFEKSMTQLRIAENCPLACILSQDLAFLLLLVVEQLAKLLLSLAADGVGEHGRSPLDISVRSIPRSMGIQTPARNGDRQGPGPRHARIGTFEIVDPIDLQMIMKLLLQIRTQALDAYIRRWKDKINSYGLRNLEADLKRILEDLSSVAFLGNIINPFHLCSY